MSKQEAESAYIALVNVSVILTVHAIVVLWFVPGFP
jgi:hypothetical protein